MAVDLHEKSVVITGAGAGLGRAYANAAAAAGAGVVVNDVDPEAAERVVEAIEAAGGRAFAVPGSIVQDGVAERLVAAAVATYGRLDGLVNNAGLRPEGPAWSEDPGAVRRAVEVNVTGAILCGIAALGVMREQGSGSVVNVSSRAQSGVPASATYAATKGALASLTYSWAIDMRPFGVRVNAAAPQASGTGTRRASTTRPGEPTPEDMAPLVVYLLSDRSSRVTGQVLRLGRPGGGPMRLALMTHPRTTRAFANDAGWSADGIAELMDHRLGRDLEPVGAVPTPVAFELIDGQSVGIESALGL